MQGLLWGTLEVTIAFVIACMPATRLFVQHFFPVLATKISAAKSTGRSKQRTTGHGCSTITSDEGGGGGRAAVRGDSARKILAESTLTGDIEFEDLGLIEIGTLEEENRPGLGV